MSRRGFKIAKLILNWIVSAVIILVAGILAWRIFWSGDPKGVSTLLVNDRTYAAYRSDGTLDAFSQSQNSLTRAEYTGVAGVDHNFTNKSNYGYFGVTQSLIFPNHGQVQVLFRYNNSTIRHLVEDYGLTAQPDREEDLYDVTLVIALDLTPDDTTDNDTAEPGHVELIRVSPDPSMTVREQKNLYNYRRFLFDLPEGISFDRVLAIYVDIYYVGDITYLKEGSDIYRDEAYGTLCIFDYASSKNAYKLTKRDKEALASYAGGES